MMIYNPLNHTVETTMDSPGDQIFIISKNEMPTGFTGLSPGIHSETRLFNEHQFLNKYLSKVDHCSISWVSLSPGETTALSLADQRTLVVVSQGDGHLLVGDELAIQSTDTVVLPKGTEYGFKNSGPGQLVLLTLNLLQAQDALMAELPEHQRVTLEDVLEYNEARLRKHVRIPFFKILEDGTLLDEKKRETFLSCLYIWSGYFQQIMLSRQATSVDERYKPIFLEHLEEELGHDKLLEEYKDRVKINDPILEATSSWFVHKMFLLDNVGKTALVHLVLEASGDEFHTRADPFLGKYVSTDYFDVHAELDEGHAEIGVELLKHQHPVTYARVLKLIEESWDMFETLMDRIVYLVNHQSS